MYDKIHHKLKKKKKRKEKVVFCRLLKLAFSEGIRIRKVVGYKYYHNELH